MSQNSPADEGHLWSNRFTGGRKHEQMDYMRASLGVEGQTDGVLWESFHGMDTGVRKTYTFASRKENPVT